MTNAQVGHAGVVGAIKLLQFGMRVVGEAGGQLVVAARKPLQIVVGNPD